MKTVAECANQVRFQSNNMLKIPEPKHGPVDRTKKLFPYLGRQVFDVRGIRRACVRERVWPCAPRCVQKTLVTFRALPSFVVWASNYPLRAKIWALQRNSLGFTRIDAETSCKALISTMSSQDLA